MTQYTIIQYYKGYWNEMYFAKDYKEASIKLDHLKNTNSNKLYFIQK